MTRPVLRASRIELRPMTLQHLPLLHGLDSDPVVMKFLLGRARTPREIDDFWAPRCADRVTDEVGLGWWVGFENDDFVGWWDLGRSASAPDVPMNVDDAEIGWRVMRRRWGQGLATEGALLLRDYGFSTPGLQRIWAETMAVNRASRSVMRKIGMRHVHTKFPEWHNPLPGADQGEVLYEITARQWNRRPTTGLPGAAT
ncbi:MAG: GNAT family N-acetyltransferase [Rhodococcus sp. (in: high G+C Gram-positive bacteria)]